MVRFSKAAPGRDDAYFDLFESAAANLVAIARRLDEMLRDWPDSSGLAGEIRDLEHEGDRITAELIRRLNAGAGAPLDREDVIALASGLDDVADFVEEAADYLVLYRIEAPMEQALELTRVLAQSTRALARAMPRLRTFGDLSAEVAEVHRLENEGDRVVREGMADLFDHGIDPMTVIRWKDIYERLEDAIDATEHVANLLDGVVAKNT